MLMRLLDGPALQVAQAALSGLSQRQEAIAANIANIDTPGYQRKDVSFEDTLRAQLAGGGAGGTDGTGGTGGGARSAAGAVALSRTDPRHISDGGSGGDSGGGLGGGSNPRDVVSSRNDANTVGVDEEMIRLVETQLRYQALSQSLGSRISTLRTVIRGQ